MKNLFKCISVFISLVLIFELHILNCTADSELQTNFVIQQQILAGKSVTANLQVKYDKPLSVIIFVLNFDNRLKYTDCKINDDCNGKILDFCDNNTLKITYVNTSGIDATSWKNIVDINFKASSEISSDVGIDFYILESVDYDENLIKETAHTHYDVEIVEKVTVSGSSNGTKTNKTDGDKNTSSSINKSNENNKSIPTQSKDSFNEQSSEYTEETYTEEKSDIINVKRDDNDIKIFIMGGIFTFGIILIIFTSYKMGKTHSKNHNNNDTP